MIHIGDLISKIRWIIYSRRFQNIGDNSVVGKDWFIIGPDKIRIGKNFKAGKDVQIEAWDNYEGQIFTPEIRIGDNVTFTDYDHISCIDSVVIEDNVLLGHNVYISDNSHGSFSAEDIKNPPTQRRLVSKGPVYIGKNVWIGRNTAVLSGVSIGANAIIGANSLVNCDIPENSLAVGNPAVVVKYLEH